VRLKVTMPVNMQVRPTLPGHASPSLKRRHEVEDVVPLVVDQDGQVDSTRPCPSPADVAAPKRVHFAGDTLVKTRSVRPLRL
jgi:hypothetical protein